MNHTDFIATRNSKIIVRFDIWDTSYARIVMETMDAFANIDLAFATDVAESEDESRRGMAA